MTLLSHASLNNYWCLPLAVLETPSSQGSIYMGVFTSEVTIWHNLEATRKTLVILYLFIYATRQVLVSSCLILIHPCIQSDW